MIHKINKWRKKYLDFPVQHLIANLGGGLGIIASPVVFPVLWVARVICNKKNISIGEVVFKWYLEHTIKSEFAWIGLVFIGCLAIHAAVFFFTSSLVALSVARFFVLIAGTILIEEMAHYHCEYMDKQKLEDERNENGDQEFTSFSTGGCLNNPDIHKMQQPAVASESRSVVGYGTMMTPTYQVGRQAELSAENNTDEGLDGHCGQSQQLTAKM